MSDTKQEETNEFGVGRQALQIYANAFNASEILSFFDLRLEFPDLNTVCAVIDEAQVGHTGGLGEGANINGGVLAAMYDLVIGASGALVDPRRRSATIQLSMNFERPVTGGYVRAEATVDRAGKTMVFASGRVVDGQGRICSHGQGVVRMSQKHWIGDSPGG